LKARIPTRRHSGQQRNTIGTASTTITVRNRGRGRGAAGAGWGKQVGRQRRAGTHTRTVGVVPKLWMINDLDSRVGQRRASTADAHAATMPRTCGTHARTCAAAIIRFHRVPAQAHPCLPAHAGQANATRHAQGTQSSHPNTHARRTHTWGGGRRRPSCTCSTNLAQAHGGPHGAASKQQWRTHAVVHHGAHRGHDRQVQVERLHPRLRLELHVAPALPTHRPHTHKAPRVRQAHAPDTQLPSPPSPSPSSPRPQRPTRP
jgi:hypothetical protein